MNEINVVFRSSIGGYKKNDVNEYIASENKRFSNVERSYLSTIENLRLDLEKAREEITKLRKAAEELEASLAVAEADKGELLSKIDALNEKHAKNIADSEAALDNCKAEVVKLKSENEQLIKVLDEKDAAVTSHTSQIESLSEQLASAKKDAFLATERYNDCNAELASVKMKLDDAMAVSLSDKAEIARLKEESVQAENSKPYVSVEHAESVASELLYKAKSASEEMLRKAEESTAVIMSKARNEAIACRSDMLTVARDMLTSVSDELHRSVDICMNDFVRGIRSAKNDSDLIADELKRCGDELGRRIERLQMELDRTISEKLSEFDRKHGIFR